LRTSRQAPAPPAVPWMARRQPGPIRLVADALWRRAALPFDLLRLGAGALRDPVQTLTAARDAAASVGEALRATLTPASPTALNGHLGPHRRFDWLRVDLDAVKAAAHQHDATVNDVVLAVAAGAIGRFLRRRGEAVETLTFRAMVPVSVRGTDERGALGNRVSLLVAPLPIAETDPRRRLAQVVETMRALKRSHQSHGTELLEDASDRLFSGLFAQLARLGTRLLPYNVVVTNVPGPPVPLYLFGAPLRAVYPLVPLFTRQALGIALFSYDGGLYWGFNADWDAVPDLHDLARDVARECKVLLQRMPKIRATRRPPHKRPSRPPLALARRRRTG
jgi:diacylglycerol O-acyltransferase / wax synthase